MHQDLHKKYVKDGWTVLSTYPEQMLRKTLVPGNNGWHIYLDSNTNRYYYKHIFKKELKWAKALTVETILKDLNEKES